MSIPVSKFLAVAAAAVLFSGTTAVCGADDSLASAFSNPPDSAKPHTWWHWMDGNITTQGLTADLEAMKQAGIGGAQLFHVSQDIPPGPVGYASPQWFEMVNYAIKQAERLGIELCIHNCAGWSSSGGPWITPEYAMQVLAWSETQAKGPARFDQVLAQPKAPQVFKPIPYYKDITVLAFPTPTDQGSSIPAQQLLGKSAVTRQDGLQPDTSPTPKGAAVERGAVVVLGDKMDASGRLTWDVPPGQWTILRIGHTPTGKDNHPAPPEGDGLEVDKLSTEALSVHWNGMMAKVIRDAGPLAPKVLNNALIDSYEVGSQNWSPNFRQEFKNRRGYDPLPYLAVVTGHLVGSKAESERFLWDFRRTVADLFADNYYGYFGELCHKHGMKFSTEPYGSGTFDNLQCGGKADIPMGEFWVGGAAMETTKLASSAGHTYGRPVIGAESFTADWNRGKWLVEPYGIKALGDLVFCNGINRYIFHRYAHQPWMDLKPGMTMGPWGTHLERTVTWWNEASAWLKYVARCQYLLQQGTFVADALYYYGENAPIDLPYRPALRPALPEGHDYDGCDATLLKQGVSVKNGQIALPSGMSYRVLVLPDTRFMTPEVARKVAELVKAGATVVGPKPELSPSLTNYPACDEQVRQIAEQVWGNVDGKGVKEHAFGQGRVIWGKPLNEVFASLNTPADFTYQSSQKGAKLVHIHRRIGEAEVYFVSNQRYSPAEVECTFRVGGKAPELWHADTGKCEQAPVWHEEGGRTVLALRLDPAESVFVVFRNAPQSPAHLVGVSVSGGEKQTSPTTPQLIIHKARYEAADGRGGDVTKRVADMVAEGTYDIPASNDVFGDTVKDVPKRLSVDFELEGKREQRTVKENETLTLPHPAGTVVGLPPYELAQAPGGAATLIPWQAGKFELKDAQGKTKTLAVNEAPRVLALSAPWTLHFPQGWGAPDSIKLEKLISWSDHPTSGVRYFSGTATYETQFDVPAAMIGSDRELLLDLGVVKNFATVKLNGEDLGILWKAPFRVDVSKAIKPGTNRLEVKVTNLWPNRLIGDEQLPADAEWNGDHLKGWPEWLAKGKPRTSGRVTFATWRFYKKDSPLLESGLVGPVSLYSGAKLTVGADASNR